MQFILLTAPFLKKNEFERICHGYSMLMDRDGGLTMQNRDRIISDLEARGFTLSYLYADINVPYEEEMILTVEATYTAKKLDSELIMEEIPLLLKFQSKVLSRKTVSG
jgi:hypothetical protein